MEIAKESNNKTTVHTVYHGKDRQVKSLADLFEYYHGDYKPVEWNTGIPVGKEISD